MENIDTKKAKKLYEWCKGAAEITPSDIKARILFDASQILRNISAGRQIRPEERDGAKQLADDLIQETYFTMSVSEAEHLIAAANLIRKAVDGCRQQ